MMSASRQASAIDTYATLLAKKLLLPSEKTKYVAVELSFLIDALSSRVAEIHVDEGWYLACNPDVCCAVQDGLVKGAREHYVFNGFYEHRMPYKILVDEAWYLGAYEDVRVAVHDAVFPSGQAHFETLGYREGRLPFSGFRLETTRPGA